MGVPAGTPDTPITSHVGQHAHMRLVHMTASLMGSCGFAAIPTTMLDPPHSAASPMVPAFIGSGSPFFGSGVRRLGNRAERVDLRDLLKLAQIILLMGRQPADDPIVREKLGDVPARHCQM